MVKLINLFVAPLDDGHTFLYSSDTPAGKASTQRKGILPIVFRVAGDGLFISQTTTDYTHLLGCELLSINGRNVDSLCSLVRKETAIENHFGALNTLHWKLALLQNASPYIGDTSVLKLGLRQQGKLLPITTVKYQTNPKWIPPYQSQSFSSDALLHYQFIQDQKAVYFKWNALASREVFVNTDSTDVNINRALTWTHSFTGKKMPKFREEAINDIPELYPIFVHMLEEMKQNHTKYLIVDLRQNTGGFTSLCMPLLYMMYGDKYLQQYDFARFATKVSALLLTKRKQTLEEFNQTNGSECQVGEFYEAKKDNRPIIERRGDKSLITYRGETGYDYVKDLDGKAIYTPHVIVLCSPTTFSAAFHFMCYLKEIGHATIVGVPSSQAGKTFMESTPFTLPESGIQGSISNSLQCMFPNDSSRDKILIPDFCMKANDFARYSYDVDAELLYALDLISSGKIE